MVHRKRSRVPWGFPSHSTIDQRTRTIPSNRLGTFLQKDPEQIVGVAGSGHLEGGRVIERRHCSRRHLVPLPLRDHRRSESRAGRSGRLQGGPSRARAPWPTHGCDGYHAPVEARAEGATDLRAAHSGKPTSFTGPPVMETRAEHDEPPYGCSDDVRRSPVRALVCDGDFAASGVLALVVGRRSEAFGVAGPARVATLVVGLAYAAAAGIVIASGWVNNGDGGTSPVWPRGEHPPSEPRLLAHERCSRST